jgi:hypothetical protein
VDTTTIESELMASASEYAVDNHHTLGPWQSYLGGAVRIAHCTACDRHALTEVLPKGDDDAGNQIYKTDIRGSAITTQCGPRKVS